MQKLAGYAAALMTLGASQIALAHGAQDPHARTTPAVEVMPMDQMLKLFGWDFDKTEIRTETLAEGFHVLFGLGGNIAVSVGKDGTLIVDDQFPQLMPKIKAALAELGSEKVDFVINTHWHFDHADGNLTLGREGSWIVSQSNSRDKMLNDHVINFGPFATEQKAYPEHALSDITFDKTMQFHINDQKIELVHVGPAHTTGDAAVIFRGVNAVHMGDVFNNAGYPFIDADNGGDMDGMIAFCQAVHDAIDDETKVVPGHGPVTTRAKLARYIAVLTIVRDRVQALIDEGKSLDDIVAAKPTADFDEEFQANPMMVPSFLSRVHASLTRD
ncbi:Glyoxylase, beta-lactamase superfamily II [Parasphingorhabdus marina DSM 22363]|uniref:Glyoxylase, beta-lactamase superfamily II n=1 Tax=Parasphingorhabdus marina DSM 22363 TaxID=1123272 RepID=A0A1N6CRW1_9SPHN|nr:MBL fold metallo-hydrolase [Parasphingorhabdus marina]SIN61225.1 Glyoxylase, beta-lactamase superfamily II [Parasphingorhabdus marina DSM 22363]